MQHKFRKVHNESHMFTAVTSKFSFRSANPKCPEDGEKLSTEEVSDFQPITKLSVSNIHRYIITDSTE